MEAARREGPTLTFPALNVNRWTLNTKSMGCEIKVPAGPRNSEDESPGEIQDRLAFSSIVPMAHSLSSDVFCFHFHSITWTKTTGVETTRMECTVSNKSSSATLTLDRCCTGAVTLDTWRVGGRYSFLSAHTIQIDPPGSPE